MPEFAAWEIQVQPAASNSQVDSSSLGGMAKSLDVKKFGKIRKESIQRANGKASDAWVADNLRIRDSSGEGDFVIIPASPGGVRGYINHPDFPLIGWVDQSSYVGVQLVAGQKCYVFEKTLPAFLDPTGYLVANEFGTVKVRAAISVEQRLPVSVEANSYLMTFKFKDAPSPETMPEAYALHLKEFHDALAKATQVPTHP